MHLSLIHISLLIALLEAFGAMLLVCVVLLLLGFDIKLALLLGAIASATAPAATVLVVKQYKAKGPVTETLLSVVALDDAVALIAFGIAMAVVNALQHPGETSVVWTVVKPFVEILGSAAKMCIRDRSTARRRTWQPMQRLFIWQ